MKKKLHIIVLLFILVLIYILLNPIDLNNHKNVIINIEEILDKQLEIVNQIEANRFYAFLFKDKLSSDYGIAFIKKGILGRGRLQSISYGNASSYVKLATADGENYFVYGINNESYIANIEITTYDIHQKFEPIGIGIIEHINEFSLEKSEINLFDKNGNAISNRINDIDDNSFTVGFENVQSHILLICIILIVIVLFYTALKNRKTSNFGLF